MLTHDAHGISRADTESKRVESSQKMMLLSQALKRYKTLDIMGDLAKEEEDDGTSLVSLSHFGQF